MIYEGYIVCMRLDVHAPLGKKDECVSGDVPDDVVYTDLHKTVRKGDSVVLTCRFRGTPLAVWWKKGDDPETSPNLVSWIPTDDVTGLCEGERPCQIMEMNANRSLVIKEVSIAEQGRYICRVTIRGILIHNFTDISVFWKVSFFELWYLVHNMNKTNLNILRAALTDLQVEVPGIEEELTADKAFDLLCDWKDANTFDNEGMRLEIVLSGRGLGHFWKEMCVADQLMKAISPQEVEGFVYRLTERHCKRIAKTVGITDQNTIATIMDENNEDLVLIQSMVNDWIEGQECCNFEKRCWLDDATIKIGRHDMTDAFGTTSYRVKTGDNLERPHPDARTFNSSSIFDDDLASLLKHLPTGAIPLFLEKLGISVDEEGDDLEKLRCWRDQNIKESKRYSLQALVSIHSDALNEANDSHVLDVNDDELENVIASMTSMKQMEELTSRLGIKNDKEQSHILHLTEWRNRCKMNERRKKLREALSSMELSGCIVDRLPAKHVYQAELVRLAWTTFYIDVWPLATLLKMDMVKEKTVGEPHMEGTIHLLKQQMEELTGLVMNRRRDFCFAIRNLGYFDVARSGYLGKEH
eukprot:XP_011661561.1 PREDICTED: uncharacterized protein LOC100893097 [Strongylocentrotus purpuratus]